MVLTTHEEVGLTNIRPVITYNKEGQIEHRKTVFSVGDFQTLVMECTTSAMIYTSLLLNTICNDIKRNSNVSALVLLNVLNELEKRDKILYRTGRHSL